MEEELLIGSQYTEEQVAELLIALEGADFDGYAPETQAELDEFCEDYFA